MGPCPEYEPMSLEDKWHMNEDGTQSLQVVLPGVEPRNRHVKLHPQGVNLQITAARATPAQGISCLPTASRVSTDGRYELFSASTILPHGGDKARLRIQHNHAGLEIILPPMVVQRPGNNPLGTSMRGTSSSVQSANMRLD